MARKKWRGDAPAVAQVDRFTLDPAEVVAEGTDLLLTIGNKSILVESPDDEPLSLYQAAADAWNAAEFGETQEVQAQAGEDEAGEAELLFTARTPGVPFTVNVTAPYATVDVDTVQAGGPGKNAQYAIVFDGEASGGSWRVKWDFGDGDELSSLLGHNWTVAQVTAALITGMESLVAGDVVASGSGTDADPLILELQGEWAETDVDPPEIVSTLYGAGDASAFVETVQDGVAGGSVYDTFTGDDINLESDSYDSDSGHTYSVFKDPEDDPPRVESNTLEFTDRAFLIPDYGEEADTTLAIDVLLEDFGSHTVEAGFVVRLPEEISGLYSSGVFAGIQRDTGGMRLCIRKQEGSQQSWFGDDLAGYSGDLEGWYRLVVTTDGADITVELYDSDEELVDTLSTEVSDNLTSGKHAIVAWSEWEDQPAIAVSLDNLSIGGSGVAQNEVQKLWHNGGGGQLIVSRPDVGPADAILPTDTASDVEGKLEGPYGAGNVSVTGSGTEADPWMATFGGSLANQNLPQMTVDATGLLPAIPVTVEEVQAGHGPIAEVWHVVLYASDGTVAYSFKSRKTTDLAYNHNAGAFESALEALTTIGAGNVTVTGSGTEGDPFVVTLAAALAGDVPQLIAHNEDLDGPLVGTLETIVASRGPNHYDDPLNWIDVDTGLSGLPGELDDVYFEIGGTRQSPLYGIQQSATKLNSFIWTSMMTGSGGLPQRNEQGNPYWEYRPRALEIGLHSTGDKRVEIGAGDGSGSSRLYITTGSDETHLTVLRTNGATEEGRAALNWWGTNAANTLTLHDGQVSVGGEIGQEWKVATFQQTGGSILFGEEGDLGDVESTGGEFATAGCEHSGLLLRR